jgi:uncharacterized protein YukE
MALVGMDIDAVRALASYLAAKADEIESISNTLTQTIGNTAWMGQDADHFRSDWQTHRTALLTVAHVLRDTSSVATRNANEQQQVSSR